jgi:hypothetical protein
LPKLNISIHPENIIDFDPAHPALFEKLLYMSIAGARCMTNSQLALSLQSVS